MRKTAMSLMVLALVAGGLLWIPAADAG